MSSLGIDISAWQSNVDFAGVISSGRSFVMARAGIGENKDSSFDTHAAAAVLAGLKLGAYWFSYASSEKEARTEADMCAKVVCAHDITYPIAFDFEYAGVKNAEKKGVNITKTLLTDMALAFCERISVYGYLPMIYTNPDYLKRYYDTDKIKDIELWLAYWQKSEPPVLDLSKKCSIWQYAVLGSGEGTTATGNVEGVSGNIDVDVCYREYNRSTPAEGVYRTVQELPKEYRAEITELIAAGALNGIGNSLDLTIPIVRSVIVAKRYAEIVAENNIGKEE